MRHAGRRSEVDLRIEPAAFSVRLRAISRLLFARGDDAVCCSFCGRDRRRVVRIVCGPGVAICDECARTAADFAVASQHVPLAADRQVMTVTPVLDPAERLTMAQQVILPEVLARCATDTDGQLLGWTYRVVPDVGDHLTFDVAHTAGRSAPERDDFRIACRAMLGLPATAWLGTAPVRQDPNRDPRENA